MPGPPDAYYEKSFRRVHGHAEPIERMKKHGILIDGEGVVDGGGTKSCCRCFQAVIADLFEFIQPERR